jgi:ATP-dependent DNA helicase RecQ
MDSSGTFNKALEILRISTGIESAEFRKNQWESISQLVLANSKVLVIERTGWGKSAVYFISTRLLRDKEFGPTIIISPLIALMRNQITSAASYGVSLGTINSSQELDEQQLTIKRLNNNELDALIISPEQLAKDNIIEAVIKPIAKNTGLLVVDEAHCISDWGHDFRPDYKRVRTILNFLPSNISVLLTTATANNRVMDDIVTQIGDDIKTVRGSLTRESLQLQCIPFNKASERLAWLAQTVPKLDGTGIIYTSTIRSSNQVARWLRNCGIDAEAYHSGLVSEDREDLENDLINNNTKVLVATSALGMGYDKPDLSFVIHYQSPGSAISYYQQVGRAGRSISKAYGVLLSGSEDDDIQKFFIDQAFPDERLVNRILSAIENSEDGLREFQILDQVNDKKKRILQALKFLMSESPAPIIKNRSKNYSRTLIDYELPNELINRLSSRKLEEWNRMKKYLQYDQCLMQYLSQELDDIDTTPCGKCSNCAPENALSTQFSEQMAINAGKFLSKISIPIRAKKVLPHSNAFSTYQFPYYLEKLQHEPGKILCYWGDPGWGELARKGKESHSFDQELVIASAKLIKKEWRPEPFPKLLTFVPSNRSKLVKEFANDLAKELDIECLDLVSKIKDNKPQKKMENSVFRCKNLDGTFAIASDIPNEPILLIDDVCDSGWTFTVISALLKQSGSEKVFPFAVASSATN